MYVQTVVLESDDNYYVGGHVRRAVWLPQVNIIILCCVCLLAVVGAGLGERSWGDLKLLDVINLKINW